MSKKSKNKKNNRTTEEIFKDLQELAFKDQGDFLAELENLVGIDLCKKLKADNFKSPTEILKYVRTNYLVPPTTEIMKRIPQPIVTHLRIGKNHAAGID